MPSMYMISLMLLFAFLPPIIYVIWIRNTEKYNREPWFPILVTFVWGATVSVIMAFLIENALSIQVEKIFKRLDIVTIVLGVIIAPLVEEFTKPLILGTKTVKRKIDEIEDGFIYGAIAGLGFSATENLIYGFRFSNEGIITIIALFYIRSIGCSLLHASATAFTGYGYSKTLIHKRSILNVIPFFIIATTAHSMYNIFAFSSLFLNQVIGVVFAVIFSILFIRLVRREIVSMDMESKT